MASVKKRSQKTRTGRPGGVYWRARYVGPDSKEHSKTFERKVDAERWATSQEAAKLRGHWVDPQLGKQTLQSWWDEYRRMVLKRATTMARDEAVMRKHFLPALGRRPLGEIKPMEVQAAVSKMRDTLAPKTVTTNYGVLRAVFSAAVESDVIAVTPCRGVHVGGQRRRAPRFLTVEELDRLANVVPSEYRAMIYVTGVLGLRWSEVAGLRVGRIDFLRRTLEVAETLSEVNGELAFEEVKTTASKATLAVPTFVLEALAKHLADRGRPDPDELVFVGPHGGPLRAGNFRSRVWKPAVRAAGVEGLTFHGLRHTAAGLMIAVGAHIEAIKQRMRHSSIRVTSDVYGSLMPSVDESVTANLDALFTSSTRSQGGLRAACAEGDDGLGQ